MWSEELGVDRVGVHDNLFELGGDSLIGVQLVNRIRKEWDQDLSTVTLYEAPTVAAIAKLLAGDRRAESVLDDSDVRARRRRSRVAARKQ